MPASLNPSLSMWNTVVPTLVGISLASCLCVLSGASPHPGVGHYVPGEDEVIQHKYYQWVSFVLFCEAFMFYLPRYIWKALEGGLMRMLAFDVLDCSLTGDSWNEERKDRLTNYLAVSHVHKHALYALKYSCVELLNLVNVIFQMLFLDLFLGHQFLTYGPRVVSNSLDDDPMSALFPKVAKCTFRDVGPSGNTQTNDALCVLSLNVFNERVFVFLWFWFVLLTLFSLLAVFYRLALCFRSARAASLSVHAPFVDRSVVETVIDRTGYGDWFVLILLAKNLNPVAFQDLLCSVAWSLDKSAKLTLSLNESGPRKMNDGDDFSRCSEQTRIHEKYLFDVRTLASKTIDNVDTISERMAVEKTNPVKSVCVIDVLPFTPKTIDNLDKASKHVMDEKTTPVKNGHLINVVEEQKDESPLESFTTGKDQTDDENKTGDDTPKKIEQGIYYV